MTQFAYRALSESGDPLDGQIEAATRSGAATSLINAGLTPVHIAEVGREGRFAWLNRSIGSAGAASLKVRLGITRGLSSLLAAGITLPLALQVLTSSAPGREARAVLGNLHRQIRAGQGFSDAVADLHPPFPTYYILMIRMGEKTGALDHALKRILAYEEALHEVRSKLLSALIYPSIIMGVLSLTFLFIIGFVMPQFAPIFSGHEAELPVLTRVVFWISQTINAVGFELVLGFGVLLLGGGVAFRSRSLRDRIVQTVFRLPVLGEHMRKRVSARYFRLLGTMVDLGVPLSEAARVASGAVSSIVAGDRFSSVAERIRGGAMLSQALHDEPMIVQLAHDLVPVGEKSGRLSAILLQISDMLDDDIAVQTDRFMAVFTPLVTVILGGITALFVAAVVVGIMSIGVVVSS